MNNNVASENVRSAEVPLSPVPEAQGRRRRVLMNLNSDLVWRDLHQSGALAELSRTFDLFFVADWHRDASEFAEYGQLTCRHRGDRIRHWVWNSVSIMTSIYRWEPIVGRLSRDFFNRKKVNDYRGTLKFLVGIMHLGLAPLFIGLGGAFLRATHAVSLRGKIPEIDCIIAPTVFRDFLADDVVRYGRARGIPTAQLQINLDNFTMKIPSERADHMIVWGPQSWYCARLVHHYPPGRIWQVGNARMDRYRHAVIDRDAERAAFEMPVDKRIVLFCGGTSLFDETRALRQIDDWIAAGKLPGDLHVVYKPHPKGLPADAGPKFIVEDFRHVSLLAQQTTFESSAANPWTDLDLYPRLLGAVDAMITPFSTMGVEGAAMGLPVLCVGYHATRPAFWAFGQHVHLHTFADTTWAVVCRDETLLYASMQSLVDKIGDANVREATRGAALSVTVDDGRNFAQRLISAIDAISANVRDDFGRV